MSKRIKVMDGNEAAAYTSYAFTEVAGIFPITPSSPMAEHVDDWAAKGRPNCFGHSVKIVEMQSEGGAAGAVHGSLQAGALTTTYTASQGLLLMIPNMYKIAGELLPGVFHVSARTLSSHALSIFGDHSDVMACRQTGFALLASANPQEVMDLGAVAHLSALEGRIPFLHFFDGFRTSHEIQKIEALSQEEVKPLINAEALAAFRRNALNPDHPVTRGTTVSPDIFFQGREAQNKFYTALPAIVEKYMAEINRLTGRNYRLFEYYGAEDATDLVIVMGSAADCLKETVDYLRAQGGKVGMLGVHLYRPFSVKHFMAVIPATVNRIAVLDRTKEPGALGEPLYQDVVSAYYGTGRDMLIIGGRYGLSSKDTTPAQMIAVYNNLASSQPKTSFTVGIEDDVTHLSLSMGEEISVTGADCTEVKIWGLGSDGTVGANKNSIKIIGDNTDMFAQAYFVYDSKKSGGLTQSHLRFGRKPILSSYLIGKADFVACHNQSYVNKYDLVKDLKDGGIFLLNCQWSETELEVRLPNRIKRGLAEKRAQLYLINAIDIAESLGLGGRTNSLLQSAFFKLLNILPVDKAVDYMKDAIRKTYAKKGRAIVDLNCAAVDAGIENLLRVEVPAEWAALKDDEQERTGAPDFIRRVVWPMTRQEGDKLPVSMYTGMEDGTWPNGTTAYEKPGTAVTVPEWFAENCIQCNQCSFVCPHAAIRPVLLNDEEQSRAPEGFDSIRASGRLKDYRYRIQVSPLDCTGCGSCANVCPAKPKALVMKSIDNQRKECVNWDYVINQVAVKPDAFDDQTVKGSQFAQPLFEFSGACAGCAETPYIKLATQLFGSRMYIANASGCSTAYSGSTPSTPYTANRKGQGPAWAMSLFEDCAEYGFGMRLGAEKIREVLARKTAILAESSNAALRAAAKEYLRARDITEESEQVSLALLNAIAGAGRATGAEEEARYILENKDYLRKRSYWAFGGDGWAYDIGYGGLDHVLASGENINLLVLDTEVYSNTGGQASKATGAAAVAKFAAGGKRTKKKDLGMMAMSYGYVYVAQVAMGADQAQTLRAFREAEAYDGPSIVIAYCPCIEHGPTCGMGRSQEEMKRAVDCGYWHLYRYNPDLKKEGKNPFILDSGEPRGDFRAFLSGEARYTSLELAFPEIASELFVKAEADARERYEGYKKLAEAR